MKKKKKKKKKHKKDPTKTNMLNVSLNKLINWTRFFPHRHYPLMPSLAWENRDNAYREEHSEVVTSVCLY